MHVMPADTQHLLSLIASNRNLLEGNYACLITSGFIHRNFSHLFFNMLGVFIFARIVERRFGFFKTMFIYFGAQVFSMLCALGVYNYILGKDILIIGASGALMGLIGCAMLLEPFCITYETFFPVPVMIKGWMFISADLLGFLGGERDGVSHLAHLFGFFSVALLVYFFSKKEKETMRAGLQINVFFLVMFLAFNWWITFHK